MVVRDNAQPVRGGRPRMWLQYAGPGQAGGLMSTLPTLSLSHTVTLSHCHWGTVMLQPEIRGSPLIGKFSKFVLMRRSRSVRLWRVEGYREVSIYYASHHLLDGRDINFLLSCKHFQFILMIHSCRTRYNLDICYSFSVLSFLWKHFPFTIPQLYLPF